MIRSHYLAVVAFLALIPIAEPTCFDELDLSMADMGVTGLSPIDPVDLAARERASWGTAEETWERMDREAVQRQDIAAIRQAISAVPDSPKLRFNEAAWYLAQGDVEAFDESLRKGWSISDSNERHYFHWDEDRDELDYMRALQMTRDAYPPGSDEYRRVHEQYCREARASGWDMTGCP